MFRKLHIQMTLFSGAVTSSILILMALICLFVSEKGIKQNSYTTFSNNAQSCISYLENQNVISHQWLIQIQNTYGIHIKVQDNGHPLFFDKLHLTSKESKAFAVAEKTAREKEGIDLSIPYNHSSYTHSTLFSIENYYAYAALVPKSSQNYLSVMILYPLNSLNHQIFSQRLTFYGIISFAILLLFIFSWFFTKKMIQPLEKSHKQQTEFIASASHELRSPLTVILSSIQAMEKSSPEEALHFYSIIKTEGNRMARLIGDMLSIANADNHSWKIFLSPCELDTLLLDTYEKYEHLMKKRGLLFSISLPDAPLPPCNCDASRIAQVLSILLDNAMTYVPSGKKVSLSLTSDSRRFYLYVSDNGPGISEKEKTSVFRRFYRVDDSRSTKEHFGLGLCIAQEILHLHKGNLKVTDTPGGGATFIISLPR